MTDTPGAPPRPHPTPDDAGRGTKGGGGDVVHPHHPRGAAQAGVCNQPLLVLDSDLVGLLSLNGARDLALVQLQFAKNVSASAAEAYGRIIDIVQQDGRPDARPSPVG